ncbi:hypothetical protein ACIQ9Q_40420 [Streptomyces sp. NPDC094438]|uniref:hypothetical protein n=1 Tax=Streptomyces sp. NPDC094438 TaxID=3366061 RepID=UPI00380AE369
MIKKILAGAAFATAATMAVAMPASAQTPSPQANATPLQIPTGTLQSLLSAAAQGPTVSGNGATDFATRNGNTAIAGEAGGIGNTYGAPLANADLRCAVPLPEGEGIGGHALGSPKTACNIAPVDQYQAPQKLL